MLYSSYASQGVSGHICHSSNTQGASLLIELKGDSGMQNGMGRCAEAEANPTPIPNMHLPLLQRRPETKDALAHTM
jgi:hypothetical protein